jgi:hypothetical protein
MRAFTSMILLLCLCLVQDRQTMVFPLLDGETASCGVSDQHKVCSLIDSATSPPELPSHQDSYFKIQDLVITNNMTKKVKIFIPEYIAYQQSRIHVSQFLFSDMFLDHQNHDQNYPSLLGSLLFMIFIVLLRLFKEEPTESSSPSPKKLKSILKRTQQERYKLSNFMVKKSKKQLHWGENQVYMVERIYYNWSEPHYKKLHWGENQVYMVERIYYNWSEPHYKKLHWGENQVYMVERIYCNWSEPHYKTLSESIVFLYFLAESIAISLIIILLAKLLGFYEVLD